MTSNTNPFNPDAKIEIDVPADGESFQDWMDKTPFDPLQASTLRLTEKEREHGRQWIEILRKTSEDFDAGLLKRADFINERAIAAAAHRLGNFGFAAKSTHDLMEIAEVTLNSTRQELYLKLILALEARRKYTHRSF